ncbi:hypothetical protein B0H19DRAFT_1155334 [Mycena capillaripes]|nr:hypothetical protein B0H19DRAFT_1155334 [Mycena capillaripes]
MACGPLLIWMTWPHLLVHFGSLVNTDWPIPLQACNPRAFAVSGVVWEQIWLSWHKQVRRHSSWVLYVLIIFSHLSQGLPPHQTVLVQDVGR